MSDARRFQRQLLLPEIGAAGQARLRAAEARVAGRGLANEIASEYARRAGIGRISPGDLAITELAPAFVQNPAAREVVAGARAALSAVRMAVVPVCRGPAAAETEGGGGPSR